MKPEPQRQFREAVALLPRIVGDGAHDDEPGLVAALRDQPVEMDGALFLPGSAMDIRRKRLRLRHRIYLIEGDDGDAPELDARWLFVRAPREGRHVNIAETWISTALDGPGFVWLRGGGPHARGGIQFGEGD